MSVQSPAHTVHSLTVPLTRQHVHAMIDQQRSHAVCSNAHFSAALDDSTPQPSNHTLPHVAHQAQWRVLVHCTVIQYTPTGGWYGLLSGEWAHQRAHPCKYVRGTINKITAHCTHDVITHVDKRTHPCCHMTIALEARSTHS
jgi:hypothetical protein